MGASSLSLSHLASFPLPLPLSKLSESSLFRTTAMASSLLSSSFTSHKPTAGALSTLANALSPFRRARRGVSHGFPKEVVVAAGSYSRPWRTPAGLAVERKGSHWSEYGQLKFSSLAERHVASRRKPWGQASAVSRAGGMVLTKEELVKEEDPTNNVSDAIFSKIGMQLHRREDHPLGILKDAIYEYFDKNFPDRYTKFDDLFPIVSTKANFDDILIPADHVSRGYNDTYYVNSETVLRCHTSAHQAEMLREGNTHFLITGDVYRRDAIDATHYPVFHQMEGFRVFEEKEWEAAGVDGTTLAATELKATLEGLAKHLFGDVEMRWVDAYFPFTDPSYELEIFFQGEWLEVLGCGVTQQAILENCGVGDKKAWAFGLGLERLAMVLFDIPDIRLFWSSDPRFTSQFKAGELGLKFKPFSKYPACYKDVSFWISDDFTENNFCEVVRGLAGDLVEQVKLIDNFTNKKGMTSHCYRITYRSMERSLTNEEIDEIQGKVREAAVGKLSVTLR